MREGSAIFVRLSDAAAQAGSDAVIFEITQGKRSALGRKDGHGLPRAIPPEHFLIGRADPRPVLDDAGSGFPGGMTWVDEPEEPWLDIAGSAIFCGSNPCWTDIQVSHQPASGAHVALARGPRPAKKLQVIAAMRQFSREEIAAMKQEDMAERFGASRETCSKARDAFLSEKK